MAAMTPLSSTNTAQSLSCWSSSKLLLCMNVPKKRVFLAWDDMIRPFWTPCLILAGSSKFYNVEGKEIRPFIPISKMKLTLDSFKVFVLFRESKIFIRGAYSTHLVCSGNPSRADGGLLRWVWIEASLNEGSVVITLSWKLSWKL
jgi:hypothetical protein